MRAQRLVHHRERISGQHVLHGRSGQQHVVTGPQPAAAPQRRRSAAGITRYGLAGMMTIPAGSRRAITTPAAAVKVSRSPARQPSMAVMARSATRPDSSIRPVP